MSELDEVQIAFGVATTQTEVDPDRRWDAIKLVSEFLGRLRLASSAAGPPTPAEDADWNIRKYVDFLRADEGDSVTLLCDNTDPRRASENNAIECNGYWTNWKDRRYGGETLEAALAEAYLECTQWRAALAHGREDAAKRGTPVSRPHRQEGE